MLYMTKDIVKNLINKISNIECADIKNDLTGDKAMDKLFSLAPSLKKLKINIHKIAKYMGITTHITNADLENYGCDKSVMKLVKYGWIKYSVCVDILEPADTENVISFAEDIKRSIEKANTKLKDKELQEI